MNHNNLEVLKVIWFSSLKSIHPVGIVKCKDLTTNDIKIYIGSVDGFDEEQDTKSIIDFGSKLNEQMLQELIKK